MEPQDWMLVMDHIAGWILAFAVLYWLMRG